MGIFLFANEVVMLVFGAWKNSEMRRRKLKRFFADLNGRESFAIVQNQLPRLWVYSVDDCVLSIPWF